MKQTNKTKQIKQTKQTKMNGNTTNKTDKMYNIKQTISNDDEVERYNVIMSINANKAMNNEANATKSDGKHCNNVQGHDNKYSINYKISMTTIVIFMATNMRLMMQKWKTWMMNRQLASLQQSITLIKKMIAKTKLRRAMSYVNATKIDSGLFPTSDH